MTSIPMPPVSSSSSSCASNYVLVAKPSSHPTLMAAVAAAEGTEQSQTGQWAAGGGARQRTYTYCLVRHVP